MGFQELENEVARRIARTCEIDLSAVSIPQSFADLNPHKGFESAKIESQCRRCNETFLASCLSDGKRFMLVQRRCEPCAKLAEEEFEQQQARERHQARVKAWECRLALLPKYLEPFDSQSAIAGSLGLWERSKSEAKENVTPEQRDNQRKIITERLKDAMTLAANWQPNSKGIGFIGGSGHAKTRLMFTLLRRLYLAGMSVEFITATAFGDGVSSRFSKDSFEAEAWIHKLATVDVFFYDDMGKETLTDRVVNELFNLIDKRCSARLPIFATANFSGAKLAARYEGKSEMSGNPILNRLRDCCESITV